MQEAKLVAVIEPILVQHGLELDSLDVTRMGKRSVLRLTVDGEGPQGRGPLLDDIASASRAISDALDESPVVGDHPFTLEVSSRGVSKPLTEAKHFRRNTGRLVQLWLADGEIVGRIVGADEQGVTLDVDGSERTVALTDINKAVVQVEMNRPVDGEEDEEN
ncbi:ribosome maturation factor RimP [Tessaracoccus sp. MC1865]|uniref:ribosome maturation factor RimP n=1 Tax=unclassified Tessaracoccus TaxID=2635419 RepID=UPI001602AE10|nr:MULTISPECIES: ribosome maturation factor RimP [unclassified Tessaracoccus]MBB1484854.1 ribosome maturation factor RimP [Tessaracoccus sp. MC1865]MBB1510178.1 ribosome maturation factor RimP [Tessaracoccus sp. MC1756]QTO38744.1 ribosome maturation factor RimP [Tessaracoccus sp. MC1865]